MMLGFWIKTASLFLIRSRRSTAALSVMITSAVAILIFLSSLAVGVNDAMVRNSVSLFSGHISGFSLPPAVKKDDIRSQEITGVLKRTALPGIVSNLDKIETANLVLVDPAEEMRNTYLWEKTATGEYIKNGGSSVFLSETVAERIKAKTGDTVSFRLGPNAPPVNLKVSGTYKTGVENLDREFIFAPYGAMPAEDIPWQAAIFLKDGAEPESVIKTLKADLKNNYDFKSWGELMPDLKQLIDLNYVSMDIVMALVFGVVATGIASAFSIFILKNMREYGIMKAMGVTNSEMSFLIIIEIIIMSVFASAAGAVLGIIAVVAFSKSGIDLTALTSHNRYFAVSGVIYPRLTVYSLLLPTLLSPVFGLASAVWPALMASRRKAADILRIV